MTTAVITAKVNPALKKEFMKAARYYDLPASGLIAMLMRMVAEGRFVPEIGRAQPDEQRTPELEAAAQQARAEYKAGKTIPLHEVLRRA